MPRYDCQLCYDDIQLKIFGFKKCFQNHTFCYECIIKLFREKRCPKDGIGGQNIIMMSTEENVPIHLTDSFMKTLAFIYKKGSDRATEVILEMINTNQYIMNICLYCLKYFKDIRVSRIFGFINCFNYHRFCFECMSKFLKTERCPVDKVRVRNIILISNDEKSHVFLQLVFMFVMSTLYCKQDDKSIKMVLDMINTGSYPMNTCMLCFKDFNDTRASIKFGFEKCYSGHVYCYECIIKLYDDKTCIIDEIDYQDVVRIHEETDEPILLENHFMEIMSTIYNRETDRANEIVLEMVLTNQYPLTSCITCMEDLKGKDMYCWEACFKEHRFCQKCIVGYQKNHCYFDGASITDMYKYDALSNETIVGKDFFKIFHFLHRNPLFRNVIQEMINTFQYTLHKCLVCCKDLEEDTYYAYEGCEDLHRFCEQCIVRDDKGPFLTWKDCRDQLYCNVGDTFIKNIIIKRKGETVFTQEYYFFHTIMFIEKYLKNSDKYRSISEIMMETNRIPLDVCMQCLADIKDEVRFGLQCCFQHHSMCVECLMTYKDGEVSEEGTWSIFKCIIDNRKNIGENIVAQRDGDIVIKFRDGFSDIFNDYKIVKKYVEKTTLQEILWRMIKTPS